MNRVPVVIVRPSLKIETVLHELVKDILSAALSIRLLRRLIQTPRGRAI